MLTNVHFALILAAIYFSPGMRPRSRDLAGLTWLTLAGVFLVVEPFMPLFRIWLERVLP